MEHMPDQSNPPQSTQTTQHQEDHGRSHRLNPLRAGVLGANDGIVSVAGLVVGVAATTTDRTPIFAAGLAGLVAGAVSMALGEYVSVSTQRDAEGAMLERERVELAEHPEAEFEELVALYESKGLRPDTARRVAVELTEHDAFTTHAEVELGIDPTALTNPWLAAVSSAVSFTLGAILPVATITLVPASWRIPVTAIAVLLALALTGGVAARMGSTPVTRTLRRVVIGGIVALALTYGVGHLAGITGI
jgi:vacuolar iron transporter family protein